MVTGGEFGTAQKRFYKQFVGKADARLDGHPKRLKGKEECRSDYGMS